MKLETKLIVTLGLLMLIGAMVYFYAFNGQLQGRFTTETVQYQYEGILSYTPVEMVR